MNRSRKKTKRRPNPYLSANIFSRISFWWTHELFRLGYKRPLEDEDLYDIPQDLDCENGTELLSKLWEEEKCKQKNPHIVRVLVKAFGKKIIPGGFVCAVVETTLKSLKPLFLGGLVSYFVTGQNTVSENDAISYAFGLILCSQIVVLSVQQYIFYAVKITTGIRSFISGLIYRKCLQISKNSTDDGLRGRAINILANDLSVFDAALCFLHDVWKGPVELLVMGYLMYREIGISALVGLSFSLCFIPIQAWGAKKAASYKLKTAEYTDWRVKLMNEIIQGIQVIKMYAWEKSFATAIGEVRRKEVDSIKGSAYIFAALNCTYMISPISIFLSLISYIYLGETLTAKKLFIISSYFAILNESMVKYWSLALIFLSESWVSLKRCNEFLLYNEETGISDNKEETSQDIDKCKESVNESLLDKKNPNLGRRVVNKEADVKNIELRNVIATWKTRGSDDHCVLPAIKNLSTIFEDETLAAIVGPVGSGKSTLLHAILGEISIDSGDILINGKISYCSQEPWVFEGTIKDNIIFVEEYDEARYREVLKLIFSTVERDVVLWPKGDLTIVGERGVSLSGGQRARVNLARAIYRKADIYLLDDPLSAVDTHVGKHIFDQCINFFLYDKIRILVTHQLQHLTEVEHLILMESGQITAQGPYQTLQSSKQFQFLAQAQNEAAAESDKDIGHTDKSSDDELGIKTHRTRLASEKSMLFDDHDIVVDEREDIEDLNREAQAGGSVNLDVYWSYFKALDNIAVLVIIIGLFIGARFLLNGMDYFLSRWVIWEENNKLTAFEGAKIGTINNSSEITTATDYDDPALQERHKYVIIYAAVLVGTLIVFILRTFGFFRMCLQISLQLHDRLFRAITNTAMLFFNTNPSGRILNRFAKDIRTLDVNVPITLIDYLSFIFDISGVLILVAIVNYWLLIPSILIVIAFVSLRQVYVNTSRSIKRLESISRSPIYCQTNQTFQGLTTIRALEAQSMLEAEFYEYQNSNVSAWFLYLSTNRAFNIWIDIICVCYVAIVTFSFLLFHSRFSSGDVGLAILQACALVDMSQWGIRQSAELENYMTSVERVMEYVKLPAESADETEETTKPEKEWPKEGRIEFINFNLKYSPTETNVLKNLNFIIEPQEKLGIVGRTGAGKSSIIQSLFRLAYNEGIIRIDGVNIGTIDLYDLRSKISIIPQDPVLFSGTLRYNLDPLEEFNDDEMWQALEDVELKEHVQLMRGLSCAMSDGGSNFSVGQRQLVCLARAILRQNKVLVLDEATANVDPITDKLIQNTIRSKFAGCTVLTIAHRLHTVMDSDRVLVMDAGCAVELGHPYELVQKSNGVLRSLVDDTGPEESTVLIQAAQTKYKSKKDAFR